MAEDAETIAKVWQGYVDHWLSQGLRSLFIEARISEMLAELTATGE